MSDFFIINFDCLSSPSIQLKAFKEMNAPDMAGWGLGWYPNDDYAATIVKDPGSPKARSMVEVLSDWNLFRSTVFFIKVKGASKHYTQQDTQPFSCKFGGCEWLFLHNGNFDKTKLKSFYQNYSPFLEPLGKTDSELAFCYLLNQVHIRGAKRLADIEWETYLSWFQMLDQFGVADIMITDGQVILMYHGKESKKDLFFTRRVPPHSNHELASDHVFVDLSDPLDVHRTSVILTSCYFEGLSQQKIEPGQMLVIRRAEMIWSNLNKDPQQIQIPQQLAQAQQSAPPAARKAQVFEPLKVEQAQMNKKIVNVKGITRTLGGQPLEYRHYKVSHVTKYMYSKPVEKSSHLFRLQPVEDAVQEILQSTIELSVPHEQIFFDDVFGNQAVAVNISSPYESLTIKSESHIKVYAQTPDDLTSPMRRSTIPLVWMPWQRQMMLPYLMPPELPESQLRELGAYAMSFAERCDNDLLATLNDMNQQIYRDFSYVSGSTFIETTPFDVFSSRKGVCQDFANLFICLARLLHVPARYRVGYIYTGGNYENKIQSEASHAWLEVYLPYLGWRGWDPTNGCIIGQDHIRVACGRNYRDATPTSGTIYKGGGKEKMSIEVKVEEINS